MTKGEGMRNAVGAHGVMDGFTFPNKPEVIVTNAEDDSLSLPVVRQWIGEISCRISPPAGVPAAHAWISCS